MIFFYMGYLDIPLNLPHLEIILPLKSFYLDITHLNNLSLLEVPITHYLV